MSAKTQTEAATTALLRAAETRSQLEQGSQESPEGISVPFRNCWNLRPFFRMWGGAMSHFV